MYNIGINYYYKIERHKFKVYLNIPLLQDRETQSKYKSLLEYTTITRQRNTKYKFEYTKFIIYKYTQSLNIPLLEDRDQGTAKVQSLLDYIPLLQDRETQPKYKVYWNIPLLKFVFRKHIL